MSYSQFDFPHTHFYDSDLRELLKRTKDMGEALDLLIAWQKKHELEYEELKELYDDIMSGDFPDPVKNAFETWMQENAIDLVGSMVKTVHFGLTNDGYFCAWIPSSWSDVQFDTITDPDDPLYGHLVLMYD